MGCVDHNQCLVEQLVLIKILLIAITRFHWWQTTIQTMQPIIPNRAFSVSGLKQHLGDRHRSGMVYWGTNSFHLGIPKKSLMMFSFIRCACVILYSLPAYSKCCFLECSFFCLFVFWQAVDDGSVQQWPRSEESLSVLGFLIFPGFHRTTSLELTSFWEASMLYQYLLLHLCSLLVVRSSTTRKFTVCRVHSRRLAQKGFLTGICSFPK